MFAPQDLLKSRQRGQALISAGNSQGLPSLKIALLCSFNLDALTPYLVEALERIGIWGEVWIGPFGQMAQEILDPASELYRFEPDLVVIIPAVEDFLVSLFGRPGLIPDRDAQQLVASRLDELRAWLETVLERLPSATVFMVPFGTERLPGPNVLHSQAPATWSGRGGRFRAQHAQLDTVASNVVMVDWDWHARPRAGPPSAMSASGTWRRCA